MDFLKCRLKMVNFELEKKPCDIKALIAIGSKGKTYEFCKYYLDDLNNQNTAKSLLLRSIISCSYLEFRNCLEIIQKDLGNFSKELEFEDKFTIEEIKAISLYKMGKIAESLIAYSSLINSISKLPFEIQLKYKTFLGYLNYKNGKYDEGKALLTETIEKSSKNINLSLNYYVSLCLFMLLEYSLNDPIRKFDIYTVVNREIPLHPNKVSSDLVNLRFLFDIMFDEIENIFINFRINREMDPNILMC